MNLLITGGAGFIGSNFILYWLKNHPEDQIVNLDKLTYAGNLQNLKDVESNPNYTFIKGDITDVKTVEDAIKGAEIVVHFAAESHVDRSIVSPSLFVLTNVVGTQVLLEASLRNNIKRFHHISTDEVYGALKLDDNKKFSETTPYDPHSPYSATKAASDHLVRAYFKTYGLPITISNCSNNYGPFQHPEKFIPLAITNILEVKKVPVYGDGLYIRDWLYVTDHCRAIDLIIQKGKVGDTYCVGGLTEDISNLNIVQKIIKILGSNENVIEHVPNRPGHDRKYAIDWSKINKELGWQPQHDFDTWLKTTIDWYQNHKDWWENIKKEEYHKTYGTRT